MLNNQELRELSRPDGWRSLWAIFTDWLAIVLLFALAIQFPHFAVWTLAAILIGRYQLALAILMHDAAHKRFFSAVRWNDYVGQFLTAAPLFFSLYSYRTLHLKHHQNPLAADDPDLSLIGGYPISRGSLARKLLRDITGVSYFKFIRYFIHMARRPKPDQDKQTEAAMAAAVGHPDSLPPSAKLSREKPPLLQIGFSIVLINLIMWFVLYQIGHGWLYLFLWVIPAITVLQVLLRIRGIAEHAGYHENKDQRLNARTVLNPFQTWWFAPHGVNYHIEHHIYPSVPYHRLPQVHALMQERGSLPEKNVYHGYGTILRELTTV